jgi:hypothetical protein
VQQQWLPAAVRQSHEPGKRWKSSISFAAKSIFFVQLNRPIALPGHLAGQLRYRDECFSSKHCIHGFGPI